MKYSLICSLLIVMSSCMLPAWSQAPHPCGTPAEKSEFLKKYQAGEYAHLPMSRNDILVLPMKVHITGEDNGTGYTSMIQIGRAIQSMNLVMAKYNLQFFVQGEVNYIDNSVWHNHATYLDGGAMMELNNVAGAINIYFCADAAGNCGYFSPGSDAIAMNDDCVDEVNHTLGHEIGHFLSLPHTFVGWEGTTYDDSQPTPQQIGGREVERTDGSNCAHSADGFCDTPPDYLSFRWSCGPDGNSFQDQFDPTGEMFTSDGTLIMSYSSGDCRNAFSQEQVDAMRANVNIERQELKQTQRPFKTVPPCEKALVVSPPFRDTVFHQDVELTWSNIVEVDYYTLEVSRNFNFSDIVLETQVEDSSYTITNIEADKNYFWRVTPYAAHAPCHLTSSFSVFYASAVSSSKDIDNRHDWQCTIDGDELLVSLHDESLKAVRLTLYDLNGRQMNSWALNARDQRIAVPHLSAGTYLARISNGTIDTAKKVIKFE